MKNTKKELGLILTIIVSISFTLVEVSNSINISNTELNIINIEID